jgi:hypothetical protein
MKNVTLSAEEHLIEEARQVAHSQHTTLNAAFRQWLQHYTRKTGKVQEYEALMKRLKHVRADGPYTRDEMNER